jgi:hypothetical protein
MPRFMEFRDDLELPAETIEQIAGHTKSGVAAWPLV